MSTKTKPNKKNAVLYKEMTMDMKKPKIMILIILINAMISMVGLIFFLIIGVSALEGVNSYRTLAWYLITTVFIEAFILLFITPAITAGTVSLEKERQTLDVLLTTRMTTWEIIKGKYGSCFVFLAFLLLSTFPMMSIIFIYGGISFFQLVYILLVLIVFIGFVASFGVFFSALTKNTIVSVILTYLFLLFYFALTFMLPFILLGLVALINEELYYNDTVFMAINDEHFINGDILMLTGTFNPILTIYDSIGNTIGYNFGDASVKGLISLCGSELMPHFTEKNLLMKAWTPISLIEMILISFGLLRFSAFLLNPVKGKVNNPKKKKR
ncbi:MAG: hypothetical protein J5856_01595 [Lachnospiraceae bacterium]|nr:hypothetical protein [Lachnospiraceae bacterium]